MAAKPEIEVRGINALVRALKRAGDVEMLAALKDANAEAAGEVHRAAAPKVPIGEGARLLGSLRGTANERGGYVRAGKKSVPYAGVIHFGWPARNIRPRPFIFDALDSRRDDVVRVYDKRIAALAARINTGPNDT